MESANIENSNEHGQPKQKKIVFSLLPTDITVHTQMTYQDRGLVQPLKNRIQQSLVKGLAKMRYSKNMKESLQQTTQQLLASIVRCMPTPSPPTWIE